MLSLSEGLAVGAADVLGIRLVSAHQDVIQGTVVLTDAMVCTACYGAFNALVCFAIHTLSSFLLP